VKARLGSGHLSSLADKDVLPNPTVDPCREIRNGTAIGTAFLLSWTNGRLTNLGGSAKSFPDRACEPRPLPSGARTSGRA